MMNLTTNRTTINARKRIRLIAASSVGERNQDCGSEWHEASTEKSS